MIKETSLNQNCGKNRECKMVHFKSPSVYIKISTTDIRVYIHQYLHSVL